MFNYLIRRLVISAITLVVISMVIFGILKIAPGDPLAGFANNPNVPIEVRAKIRKNMGLDDPIPLQYAKWAREYVRGDWGQSFLSRAPAREIIFARLPTTLKIVGTAYLISIMIAIPIGTISAIRQYSAFDQISTTFAFLGYSLPTFFSGLVLIVIFSFFVMAIQLFVSLIEFKLTTLAGFVLVPFGLFGRTAFLAERVLGNVVSSGIKILVLAVIIGIGSTIFNQFTSGFNNPPTIADALTLILAALALLGLSIFGPGIANGLIAGWS